MKTTFQNITNSISKRISQETLIKITGEKLILPFYHAVSNDPAPHFSELSYFRTEQQFIDDLNFFQENFESTPMGNFVSTKKHFHVTFDDGMSEMYDVVFPLLKARNIHATFFINTDFVDNKRMFISHKKSLIKFHVKNSDHNQTVLSDYLNMEKAALQNEINRTFDEQKIDEIAHCLNLDFGNYLSEKKPYMSLNQITELKKAGFTIGNHGRSHRDFNTLNFQDQISEIETVNNYLKKNDVEELYFAFPYGDHQIKNELFDWMYTIGQINLSFGVSGLKKDCYTKHFHRILMEQRCFSAEEIIKAEYFYYFWKSFLFRNKIQR